MQYKLSNVPNQIICLNDDGSITFFDIRGTGLDQTNYQNWLNLGNQPLPADPPPAPDPDIFLDDVRIVLHALLDTMLVLNQSGAWTLASLPPAAQTLYNKYAALRGVVLK
jgi:hypothetical protein